MFERNQQINQKTVELNKRNELLNQQTNQINEKTRLLSEMAAQEKKSQDKLMSVVSQVAGTKVTSNSEVEKYLKDFSAAKPAQKTLEVVKKPEPKIPVLAPIPVQPKPAAKPEAKKEVKPTAAPAKVEAKKEVKPTAAPAKPASAAKAEVKPAAPAAKPEAKPATPAKQEVKPAAATKQEVKPAAAAKVEAKPAAKPSQAEKSTAKPAPVAAKPTSVVTKAESKPEIKLQDIAKLGNSHAQEALGLEASKLDEELNAFKKNKQTSLIVS